MDQEASCYLHELVNEYLAETSQGTPRIPPPPHSVLSNSHTSKDLGRRAEYGRSVCRVEVMDSTAGSNRRPNNLA